MAISATAIERPGWLRSSAAIVLAFTVYNVVAALIAVPLSFVGIGLIEIASDVLGGLFGIILAKKACDRFIRAYSGKAVCVFFCLFSFSGLAAQVLLWPEFDLDSFLNVVQLVTAIVVSISTFWMPMGSQSVEGRRTRKIFEPFLLGVTSLGYVAVSVGILVGWTYWLFMSVKVSSFVMFIFGLLGPCAIPASLLGLWSFLFGVPGWLLHLAARF